MIKQLYSYALIRSFYDLGNDYLDAFWPMLVCVLPINKTLFKYIEIKSAIKDRYDLDIPIYTLEVIATRAKRKGFVKQIKHSLILTDEGAAFVSKLETEREVERRVNELTSEASVFISNKIGRDIDDDTCKSILKEFIDSNQEFIIGYIQPVPDNHASFVKINYDVENAIYMFLLDIEQRDPSLYKTAVDMIHGSILTIALKCEDVENVQRRFHSTEVFLDTNIIFSLLELHHKEANIPAQELFELMSNERSIKIKVFDFTVEELIQVLKLFNIYQYRFHPKVKVASIYSSLSTNGWSNTKVLELICSIENTLNALGITIVETGISLNKYIPSSDEEYNKISKYKPDQGINGKNHDLAAIDKITRIRKKTQRDIRNCRAMFITADRKLAKFALQEYNHLSNHSISEVIPDKLLATLLWLRCGKTTNNLSLESLIAVHSRNLFVDRDVWGRFYDLIRNGLENKSITNMDATIIIYDSEIQSILRNIDPRYHRDVINEQWLKDQIKRTKDSLTKERAQEIQDIISKTNDAIQDAERIKAESNALLLDSVEKIKKTTSRQIRYAGRAASLTITIILALCIYLLINIIINNWIYIEPISWVVSIGLSYLIFIIGERYNPAGIRQKIRSYFYKKILERNMKLFGPNEILR